MTSNRWHLSSTTGGRAAVSVSGVPWHVATTVAAVYPACREVPAG